MLTSTATGRGSEHPTRKRREVGWWSMSVTWFGTQLDVQVFCSVGLIFILQGMLGLCAWQQPQLERKKKKQHTKKTRSNNLFHNNMQACSKLFSLFSSHTRKRTPRCSELSIHKRPHDCEEKAPRWMEKRRIIEKLIWKELRSPGLH